MPRGLLPFIFLLTVAAVAMMITRAVRLALGERAASRATMLILGWLVITFALANSGVLARFDSFPAPLQKVILPTALAFAILSISSLGRRVAGRVPVGALVGFHAFRIAVEIVLFGLHGAGLVPRQMTFEGLNFDVVTGVTAIPVALLAARGSAPRALILGWNMLGFALLAVVVVIANRSVPGPLNAFPSEPPLTAVARAPWVWLPLFLVPSALAGHILIFRALRADPSDTAPPES